MRATACNGLHSVRLRCARWVLIAVDRLSTDGLSLTHDRLAYLLVVTRPTLSIAFEAFQKAGILDVRRREIIVLDRAELEKFACECYLVLRAHIRQRHPSRR